MSKVQIAVNIVTYHRKRELTNILEKMQESPFFDDSSNLYGAIHIFVTDNANDWNDLESDLIHIKRNPEGNTGGSGGFQQGINRIRESKETFTHVVFMDDDVAVDALAFVRLYEYLRTVSSRDWDRPVAGRMLRKDNPDIQWTAAEIWNKGNIEHLGFQLSVKENCDKESWCDSSGAEYGGWWFCCYPMSFVKDNDIIPFFIHCDDVEYGLRCGKQPVILKDVQVVHETYEYRDNPIIHYYDTRNPLFVNSIYGRDDNPTEILKSWKTKITEYHIRSYYDYEYYSIKGMVDYLRGLDWLYAIHPGKYHEKLLKKRIFRYRNSILWRYAQWKFCRHYGIKSINL